MNNNIPVVRVAFLDVGQGDTTIISLPETKEAVIVDCVDANVVMRYLEREKIQQLRGLLVTHLHLDHFSGVVQFLDNVEQELNLICERVLFHMPSLSNSLRDVILNDGDGHANDGLDARGAARKRKNSIIGLLRWVQTHDRERYNNLAMERNITLPLEEVIELIHPWEIDIPDLLSRGLNNTSAIVKVHGANSSAILTGDIEPFGWTKVDKGKVQADVLKFPHHGAWRDNDVNQLLDAVKPSIVVISVGTSGIRYDHPNLHVFEAIAQLPDTRLLCIQATAQCAGDSIEDQCTQVASKFREQASQSAGIFFNERKGCPCAGTIVIELSDSINVLQPDLEFHQNMIIRRFYDDHRCHL